MTITAKIIENGKFKEDIDLLDSPSDNDFADKSGGNIDTLELYRVVPSWDVVRVASLPNTWIVVGARPTGGGVNASRSSCTLTNDRAENLIDAIDFLWKEFGVRPLDPA